MLDGIDGFQIWRVAPGIMHKQSRTATAPHPKKPACYEMLHRTLERWEINTKLLWETWTEETFRNT